MKVLFILESLIYFVCLSVIIQNIFDCIARRARYVITFMIYFCVLLTSCILKEDLLFALHMLFPLFQILALYFAFYNAKLLSVIYTYVFIYSINSILVLLISITSNMKYDNTIWLDFIVNSFTSTLCIILCFTKLKTKIQQIRNWTPISAKRLMLLLLVVGMILLGLVYDDAFYANTDAWFEFVQKGTLVAVILLLILTGFLACVMFSNNQLKQLTQNYEQQIQAQAVHYKLLAESMYELRRFKHDFKNMSIAMEKLLIDKKNLQALQLFKQYNHTLENPSLLSILFDTGNGIVDALLTDKQQKALSCNTKIVFQGAVPLQCLSPTDICVILGNTLDNAIEACEKLQTQNESIISVVCNCNSGFMFLSISNPISEKVNIQNNYISTTKENKTLHGFGLYSLYSVVKKYGGNIELNATDNVFTANIDLSLISFQQ